MPYVWASQVGVSPGTGGQLGEYRSMFIFKFISTKQVHFSMDAFAELRYGRCLVDMNCLNEYVYSGVLYFWKAHTAASINKLMVAIFPGIIVTVGTVSCSWTQLLRQYDQAIGSVACIAHGSWDAGTAKRAKIAAELASGPSSAPSGLIPIMGSCTIYQTPAGPTYGIKPGSLFADDEGDTYLGDEM